MARAGRAPRGGWRPRQRRRDAGAHAPQTRGGRRSVCREGTRGGRALHQVAPRSGGGVGRGGQGGQQVARSWRGDGWVTRTARWNREVHRVGACAMRVRRSHAEGQRCLGARLVSSELTYRRGRARRGAPNGERGIVGFRFVYRMVTHPPRCTHALCVRSGWRSAHSLLLD